MDLLQTLVQTKKTINYQKVDEIPFDFERRRMSVVVADPAGKTTMIKMINRLLEPTDGNIYMDGKRIKDYDERELRLSRLVLGISIDFYQNFQISVHPLCRISC